MDLRYWAKQFIPPVFLNWYRAHRSGENSGYIWSGIYQYYRDVPVSGAGYNTQQLVSETLAYTQKHIAISSQYGTIPSEATVEHSFLSFLVSLICADSGFVRVLDFGGGMGISYVHLKTGSVTCNTVDYHVVENNAICEMGARLFEHDSQIHFHDTLPTELSKVDVVYICSSLQYVENYSELLTALCHFQPSYFLFVKLSSGDIPTYATAQKNLHNTTLPYWFVNVREIIRIMADNGYSLIFKGALDREYDQSNFPRKYRLGKASNLLFRKTRND